MIHRYKLFIFFLYFLSINLAVAVPSLYPYTGFTEQPNFRYDKNLSPYISNYGPLYNQQYKPIKTNSSPYQVDIQGQNSSGGFYTGISKNFTF
ncbi:hypothetical protein CHQ84_01860 [Francisella noatunensis subsp. orientalis]|uniref:Uncharacterized protein n=1 Tax=Francisella orientalis TaxID=299583 RepID=A0AAP7FVI6_9GAMM|nr:hypothetical protein OOM_0302 [Francisella orientalis str. Toba 04]AHB97971.1 hypothetical protein M973_01985 [Francisella orientalis LADL 07-285A]AKN85077.1 hypothetical protein FNO12_0301 [Francisella orientalis FNO12]AKN86615.1 Hypothetical protein FNO24_0301 [Francisella orientalis FNO24]AKN88153.1 Hypothetical protein FNO190_0301 [Francisella orientalis]